MKTVELSYVNWAAVAYAMEGKIESLKALGLRREAEDLKNILNEIERQVK